MSYPGELMPTVGKISDIKRVLWLSGNILLVMIAIAALVVVIVLYEQVQELVMSTVSIKKVDVIQVTGNIESTQILAQTVKAANLEGALTGSLKAVEVVGPLTGNWPVWVRATRTCSSLDTSPYTLTDAESGTCFRTATGETTTAFVYLLPVSPSSGYCVHIVSDTCLVQISSEVDIMGMWWYAQTAPVWAKRRNFYILGGACTLVYQEGTWSVMQPTVLNRL